MTVGLRTVGGDVDTNQCVNVVNIYIFPLVETSEIIEMCVCFFFNTTVQCAVIFVIFTVFLLLLRKYC